MCTTKPPSLKALNSRCGAELNFSASQSFTSVLFGVQSIKFLRPVLRCPKLGKTRYAPKTVVATIISRDFFAKKDFDNPGVAGNNLVSLVAQYVWNNVDQFAPKLRPSIDSYSTVVVKDPSSGKERATEVQEYL